MGGIGGGDVKLMGAVGAIGGLNFAVSAIYYGAICGGIAALVYMAWYGVVFSTFCRIGRMCVAAIVPGMRMENEVATSNTPKMPYATLGISIGTIIAIFGPLEIF